MPDLQVPQPELMRQAIALATANVTSGRGGPFGALIARGSEVVATGVNLVTATNDPTAHAEITAIRRAAAELGSFTLAGCQLYTSCEPCPMCMAASYWSRLDAVIYGNSSSDAHRAGFDDSVIYDELARAIPAPLHADAAAPRGRGLGEFRRMASEHKPN